MQSKLYSFILTIAFMIVSLTQLTAQQEAHYTHFMYNQQWLNPGYIGSRNVQSVTGLFRRQWLAFDGAPASQMISYNGPLMDKRVALGLSVAHFGIGLFNNNYGNLGFSYAIVKSDKLTVRAGLHGSIKQMQLDPNAQNAYIPYRDDPALSNASVRRNVFNAGAGVWVQTEKLFGGVGLPSLLTSKLSFSETSDTVALVQDKHFFVTMGGLMSLSSKFMLRPSIIVKFVQGAPFNIDVNAMAFYNRKVGLGVSYRLGGDGAGDSVDGLLHYQVSRKVALGFSYDYTLSRLSNVNSGSIEAFARFEFGKNLPGGNDLTNPRFFY
jgi:type IX secretion system PorP/SprF family membrane protein